MKCHILFVVFSTTALCSSEEIFREETTGVTFTPAKSSTVKNLVWKFKNDKIAEFDPAFGDKAAIYYGSFDGRTKVDVTTGKITLSSLTLSDSGEFSVDINNVLSAKFLLKVIPLMSNPIITRNMTEETKCVLVCAAENSLNYEWTGHGEPGEKKNVLIVSASDPSNSYTCIASNQATLKNATVEIKEICEGDWVVTGGAIAGIVIGLLLLVVTGGVTGGILYKKGIFTKKNNSDNTGGNGDAAREDSASKDLMGGNP